jgi:alpha-tubulin suppressor-like RCC1 family protein
MKNKIKSFVMLLVSVLILTGCGSGSNSGSGSSSSDNTSNKKTGTLIDDVLTGIKYVNGDKSGFTDENGNFPYNAGLVEFYLGKIKIGELNALPSDNKVFIQDIVGVERTKIEDINVLKIATLLQSLDSNSKTSKIEIPKDTFDKFNDQIESLENIDLDTLLSDKGFRKVNEVLVKRHLNNALKSYGIVESENKLEFEDSSISNNEYGVNLDSLIEIEFNDVIKKSDLNKKVFELKDSKNKDVEFKFVYDFDTVSLSPKENLKELENYTISINVDKMKNYSSSNDKISFSFTTSTPPLLHTNMDSAKNITIDKLSWFFEGTSKDDKNIDSLTLTLNGETTDIILNDGFFSLKKDLIDGENIYKILVKDSDGIENFVQGIITVNTDNNEDKLLIKTNVDSNELSSKASTWDFKGSSNPNAVISKLTLELNGKSEDLELINEKFSIVKNLNFGSNTFKLIVEDASGKREEKVGTIYFGSKIAAANAHSGAIKNNKLYTWGRNNYAQTGLGYVSKLTNEDNGKHPSTPLKITTPVEFKSIAFRQNTSFALDENGNIYSWGYDKNGELGRGDENRADCSRTADCRMDIGKIEGLSNIVAIAPGLSHSLALNKDGKVWAWGTGKDGELGDGKGESSSLPVQVDFEDSIKIVQIATGSDFSLAIDDKSQLWAWGKNDYGQMAQGDKGDDQLTPIKISIPNDEKVHLVTAGTRHVLLLTQKGSVYGWGLNASSQIGFYGQKHKDKAFSWERNIYSPKLIVPAYSTNKVVSVAAGGNSSYLIKEDGKVYPWGQYGETHSNGSQEYNNLDFPQDKLKAITSVKEISAGALHVTALKKDNTVFTWRWSFEGSLGGDSIANIWFYLYPVIPEFPAE